MKPLSKTTNELGSRSTCIVPVLGGVKLSFQEKEALWDKFYMAAPR